MSVVFRLWQVLRMFWSWDAGMVMNLTRETKESIEGRKGGVAVQGTGGRFSTGGSERWCLVSESDGNRKASSTNNGFGTVEGTACGHSTSGLDSDEAWRRYLKKVL